MILGGASTLVDFMLLSIKEWCICSSSECITTTTATIIIIIKHHSLTHSLTNSLTYNHFTKPMNISNTIIKFKNKSNFKLFKNSKLTFSTSIMSKNSISDSNSSSGQLYKFQDNLPSLPVPKLNDTLKLYKESIKPLYPNGENDSEFIKYSKIIDDFGNSNDGLQLQSKLENFSIDKRNWLSTFWDNYAYLDYRDPVSPFVSYFFSHKDLNNLIGKNQIIKSTVLTLKVLEFMKYIETETLEPELIKNSPFCMESFKWMFNNCRIPGKSSDYNLKFNFKENRFMIVISNGYIYKLQTHNLKTDEILNFNEIFNGLNEILLNSIKRGKSINPIGILTSSNRDIWYSNFEKLKKISIINEINLNEIFKSSFVLCLDDNLPNTIESKSKNCWFGNGFNRWFDKPLQFFVSKNGSSGFLGEHSKMDGTPTLRLNNWLVEEISNYKLNFNENSKKIPKIKELNFEINNEISNSIKNEINNFNKTVNSLDIKTWQYFGLGKDDIKTFKCSPDSFVQMLIQLAYYKYTGTLRPTYESASTRKYFKGRTETNRSVSVEALKFVKDWENVNIPIDEKLKSFRDAIKSHGNYIKLASSGMGVDRHLFGLKQMIDKSTNENSDLIDNFFNNPIFNYSQYWYLSTSQLSSENFNGYGWAPVVPEGFGLAYMINKNWLHINITNYKENPFGLKVDELAYFLTLSVQELKDALSKETIKSKL